MTEAEADIRESLLGTLSFLSSSEEQLAFAKNVFYASYQDEFACWWFDTFYPEKPSSLHMFTGRQLDMLKTFSADFERRLAAIGSQSLPIGELLEMPDWQCVMETASRTAEFFNNLPNPALQRTASPPLN